MFPVDVYDNEFFRSNGFVRKQCPSGAWFWTTNEDTVYSGVQPEVKYTFMGKQVFDRSDYTLREIRAKSVAFFERHGHAPMASYPVLASLWRNDLLFTSASICDFQPHVIERQLEPQANPIVVPQKCIRLNDLENIGRSGRHLTSFTMLGHHAFNFEGEPEIYWVARTNELCHKFFVGDMGADGDKITYVESVWAGGGNAGPCVEVMYEGIEIATLVFMCFKEDPEGEVNIKGIKYSPMPTRVVDTGYGLERILWAANGTPNIYQAVSPAFLHKLVENTGVETSNALIDGYFSLMSSTDIETPLQYEREQAAIAEKLGVTVKDLVTAVRPSETLYTLCDFTRTIILMLNDHVLPSNKDAGYLVRHLSKRVMTMLTEEEIDINAPDLFGMQFDTMVDDFPELEGKRDTVVDIIGAELERHESTMERGRGQLLKEIRQLKKKRTTFPEKKVFFFYDTLGLPLPYIKETVAEESDLEVEISENFWEKFFNQSMALAAGDKGHDLPTDVDRTTSLYDEDPYATEADGKILRVHGDWLAMDQTVFYPEGGGQPADHGTLSIGAETFEVDDVRYSGGAIFHHLDRAAPEALVGERAAQKIDWSRRYKLMKAHTTTHVLNATLRDVLGFHVRQMGAQKGTDSSRFDIAHYKNIFGPDESAELEEKINAAIFEGRDVRTDIMKRGDAEEKYGFFIYQGGFVPFDQLRIVNVDGIDTEACAGTHLNNIREASLFKLLGVSQIQNNVYRLRYSVADSALGHYQESEGILSEILKLLGSARDVTAQKVAKLFEENKEQAKRLADYEESLLQIQANASKIEGNGNPTTYFFKSMVPKDRAMRHIIRMARTGANQAYFVVFKDGALFIRSKDMKKLNFRDAAEHFADFSIINAGPDMIVFGGEPEAGAAWDVGRKVLGD